jgi:hypothetical protein
MNFVEMMMPLNKEQSDYFYNKNLILDFTFLENGKSVIYNYENPYRMFATLYQADTSEMRELKFIEKHLKTFKDTDWHVKIENRHNLLKP